MNSMSKTDCLLIIPAYNEERNVGHVLRELRGCGVSLDLIVINDGSADQTVAVVQGEQEKTLSLPFNLGYGCAVQTGFKLAAALGYEYVIQFDADGQHDPQDIAPILTELRQGGCDLVIGSRFRGSGYQQLGLAKRVGISLFRYLIAICTGVRVTDPTSGLRGLSKRALHYYATMGHFPEDYPDADTLIQTLLAGFSVKEIPANMHQRRSGTSMQHGGAKTIYYMAKMLVSVLVVVLRAKFHGGSTLHSTDFVKSAVTENQNSKGCVGLPHSSRASS